MFYEGFCYPGGGITVFYEGFVLPRMPRQRRAEVARAGHPPWDTGEHWGTGKAKAKLRLS